MSEGLTEKEMMGEMVHFTVAEIDFIKRLIPYNGSNLSDTDLSLAVMVLSKLDVLKTRIEAHEIDN